MKKITQIMCFYNEEKYLYECIENLLEQTYKNLEIIIINDGSTDGSWKIVESFSDPRLVLINNKENHGLAWSRNQGLEFATGEYIGFIDADDMSMDNRIEVLAEYLDKNKNTVAVSCELEYIDEAGNVIGAGSSGIYDDKELRSNFLFGNPFAGPCALFRRELIDKYKVRHDVTYRASQDYHFWLQCLPYGEFHVLSQKLLKYRIHNSQTTKFVKNNELVYEEWMHKIIDYAWKTRGFIVEKKEIDFIYRYMFSGKELLCLRDMYISYKLYEKIKKQSDELNLPEKDEICKVYKNKIQLWKRLPKWCIKIIMNFYR